MEANKNNVSRGEEVVHRFMVNLYFANFLNFVNGLISNDASLAGLEYIVGPLFCHLYIDELEAQQFGPASTLQAIHQLTVVKIQSEDSVKAFISNLQNLMKCDVYFLDFFRKNKYIAYLSRNSVKVLKELVAEKCHSKIQEAFQKWFDIREFEHDHEEETVFITIEAANGRFQVLKKKKNLYTSLPLEILHFSALSETRDLIHCGAMNRDYGIIAFSQIGNVSIRAMYCRKIYDDVPSFSTVPFKVDTAFIKHIAISPGGNLIATASSDSNTVLYKNEGRVIEKIHTYEYGYRIPVTCLAFSSSSIYLATGCKDAIIRVWSTIHFLLLKLMFGHTEPITTVQFHPNNLYLISGSQDRSVRIWNVDTANLIRLFPEFEEVLYSIAFNPSGSFIATATDVGSIQVWNSSETTRFDLLEKQVEIISNDVLQRYKLAWNENGSILCAGSNKGEVKMWDILALVLESTSNELKVYNPGATAKICEGPILDINSFNHGFAFLTHP